MMKKCIYCKYNEELICKWGKVHINTTWGCNSFSLDIIGWIAYKLYNIEYKGVE